MKFGSLSLGFALLALSAVGCGRPLAGSCSSMSGGTVIQCIEFHEGYTADQVQASCPSSANASFSSSTCTEANRLGKCEVSLSVLGITVAQTLHYYPPTTAATAMTDCNQRTAGGASATFTAN
jgi:hypothetical protein